MQVEIYGLEMKNAAESVKMVSDLRTGDGKCILVRKRSPRITDGR
jgi:hypothetical protein